MLRKLTVAATLAVLSAEPAKAQVTGHIPNTGYDTGYGWNAIPLGYGYSPSPEDSVRAYEIEQRYRETLRTKIPDRKPSNDPWKAIRPASSASVDRHSQPQ
ncbi:MAG: hypothetical protein WCG92_19025 [Hyphomicrobiales bacterium]|nr:hypothetical protein [Alphaproteobacteria bacterium]